MNNKKDLKSCGIHKKTNNLFNIYLSFETSVS